MLAFFYVYAFFVVAYNNKNKLFLCIYIFFCTFAANLLE